MKIVLSTPLYPPDIAEPAPYAKELARRLAKEGHEVVVVAFGRLPEKVAGVSTVAIDKRAILPMRLLRYMWALFRATRGADLIYLEHGPSVELTAGLVARLTRTQLILHAGDPLLHAQMERSFLRRIIARFAQKSAQETIKDSPLSRPEILPLEPAPLEQLAQWEASWNAHITLFARPLHHAN